MLFGYRCCVQFVVARLLFSHVQSMCGVYWCIPNLHHFLAIYRFDCIVSYRIFCFKLNASARWYIYRWRFVNKKPESECHRNRNERRTTVNFFRTNANYNQRQSGFKMMREAQKKTPVQSSTFIIRLTFSNRSKYIESKTTKKYNSNDFGHFSITFCDRQFWQFFILELILLTFYQLMSQSINVNWPIEIDKLWKTNSVLNFLAHVELIKSLKSNLMQVSWLFLFITFRCCDSDVRCGYPFKLTTNVE